MSTPAGWYDDGSGRQRWWDGTQWTENYAPDGTAAGSPGTGSPAPQQTMPPAQQTPYAQQTMPSGQPAPAPAPSVLGFVGLALAVLGTILVLIPVIVVFVIGAVLLLAALVVSIIALFKKGTKKWPAIVGVVLSVVGGIVGAVVFTITLLVTLVGTAVEQMPTHTPPPTTSEEPSDPATAGRPSPDEIADGYVEGLAGEAGLEEFTTPEVAACIGQYYYDSDVSDELLQKVADGEVITEDIVGDEMDLFQSVIMEAAAECVPQ